MVTTTSGQLNIMGSRTLATLKSLYSKEIREQEKILKNEHRKVVLVPFDIKAATAGIDSAIFTFAKTSAAVRNNIDAISNNACYKLYLAASLSSFECDTVKAYAQKIATNLCKDEIFKKCNGDYSLEDLFLGMSSFEEKKEEKRISRDSVDFKNYESIQKWERNQDKKKLISDVQGAINIIEDKNIRVMLTMEVQGYSRAEIAKELGVSESCINVRFNRLKGNRLLNGLAVIARDNGCKSAHPVATH